MSVRVEQAKWAVVLASREEPPGGLPDEDDDRVRWSEIDVDSALRGFSIDIDVAGEEDRWGAVAALEWLRDPRGISPLLRALEDRSVAVRWFAACALARVGVLPDWCAEPLAHALRDQDVAVRAQAAGGLGRCRCDASVDALVEALGDSSETVRAAAARALGELGECGYCSDRAVEELADLLGDSAGRVAYDAFWALRWQAGSSSDERCSNWQRSDAGQRAWLRATG